ncbi:MAG: hypothetical protein V7L21_21850 [Nostoc sp.]|uniref:hypothetical protein n=1 Tax=unclassified Nostoc TaxID=2593658 RepID=UPI002600BD67|nr:hypothetical protein [Nostoc sp. NMS9]MBN3941304.1 hypothetical protein [Nostoc sp. NMS9]
MANIKIAELQSSLLEEVSVIDLDAVHGGTAPPIQAVGGTSGGVIGFASGGSTTSTSNSFTFISGQLGNAFVAFGTTAQGTTSPT